MRITLLLVWTYFMFAAQTTVCPRMAMGLFVPNLIWPSFVLLILQSPRHSGLLWAAGWGLLYDCLGSGRLGMGMIWLTLLAAMIQWARTKADYESITYKSLLMVMVVQIGVSAELLMQLPDLSRLSQWPSLLLLACGTTFYSAMFGFGLMIAQQLLAALVKVDRREASETTQSWKMLTG